MLAACLLALGVAAPASPAASAASVSGEVVRAVRVDSPDRERLRPLVDLSPGKPFDPEAVRSAVELMFATGRYEDVPVDVVREASEGGVDVVFRPRPAPLLVRVRIEGDRVLAPGRAARIARLRPGDPLWPSRLERAARDIGLALAQRGHLEALVEPEAVRVPGGADALFRIRAGPRVRVGGAAVEGAEAAPGLGLEAQVRPRRGEVFRRDTAEAARDAMRRTLVQSGRWRAEVDLRETYDPGRGLMNLVFHVTPGPRMSLETRGATAPSKLLSEVRGLVRDGGAGADSLEAGAQRLETWLRAEGHRDAVVRAVTETRASGEAIVYELEPGPRAVVSAVEIRDADPLLAAGLRTQPGRPLVDAAVDEDARSLRGHLEESGHFEARVEADVADGGGSLPVVFLARPGPRALVTGVEVEGPSLPTTGEERAPELDLQAGRPYRLRDLARSRDTLLSAWRRAGYLDARVRPEVELDEAREAARVRLVVEPGERTIVEHVVLAGLGRTRDVAVEREMVLRTGEPFSFERLLESQRRLSALGIFERVQIAELDPAQEERRDVVVSVQEAPATSWSWGLGYSEQDRLRGSVELTRRNLGGVGRTASVFARASFRGSRLLLNLREPWLFGRRLDSFLTGFWEEENRTTFDYTRKGGIVQAGRALDSRTSLILRYLYQDTNVFNIQVPIEDIDRQYRTYTVSGPSASVVFDSRDDPLEPKHGVFLGADLQLSLQALGGESYLKGFFQATNVARLRPDLLFVLSARLGLASTFGDGSPLLLPLPERFFAGGDYGPRGFPVDDVGPKVLSPTGGIYPTGGNAMLLGGAEFRLNVTRSFQLASFLDTGNVYPETRDLAVADLRWSAGLGVRYRTPIGPVRVDWGYVLDPQPGDPGRSHFHLSIGHAF